MNAKRGIYNILYGFLGQIIIIALGIVIPRLIIVSLGSEVNGLLSSVNSLMGYLTLLEAGIGSASVQALYGPVAKGNKEDINAILAATHHFYKRTARIYLIMVIVLSIGYTALVKSSITPMQTFLVVIFSGIGGVISYIFQAKYSLLLRVEGKSYIMTNLTTIITVLKDIGKIVLIVMGANVVHIQLMSFAVGCIQVIYIMAYINMRYKWIDLKVKPAFEAISQSKSVMVHQISGMIFDNTDTLILTLFCGLKTVSVYTMYTMLFGMVKTAITTINSGVTFALGQKFNSDYKAFVTMHDAFEVYNMALVFALYSIATIFILPFMKLYTAGVSDISYIDNILPYLFVATFLLANARVSSSQVITYAGHFKKTQNRAIIESVINLSVSLICVNFIGIYGVLIGTIAAMLYRSNDMILYSAKYIMHRSPFITYRRWVLNTICYIAMVFVGNYVFNSADMNSYIRIILYAAVTSITVLAMFFIVNSLAERKSFVYVKEIALMLLKKKR